MPRSRSPTPSAGSPTIGTTLDAIAIGLDPEALREQTRERMAAWNGLRSPPRDRFLDVAATRDVGGGDRRASKGS